MVVVLSLRSVWCHGYHVNACASKAKIIITFNLQAHLIQAHKYFSICLADPESIYIEHDLNLVRDKFSLKLYLRANVNKIVKLNISPVYCVVQSSFV